MYRHHRAHSGNGGSGDRAECSLGWYAGPALSAGARRDSYRRARRFLARFFPDYCGAPFLCTSWLLAPGLRACLPEGSRILSFQDDFEVTGIFPDRDQFLTWVYKRPDIPLMDLPEDTSLQRNLKQYLLRGGKIGEAAGRLICP